MTAPLELVGALPALGSGTASAAAADPEETAAFAGLLGTLADGTPAEAAPEATLADGTATAGALLVDASAAGWALALNGALAPVPLAVPDGSAGARSGLDEVTVDGPGGNGLGAPGLPLPATAGAAALEVPPGTAAAPTGTAASDAPTAASAVPGAAAPAGPGAGAGVAAAAPAGATGSTAGTTGALPAPATDAVPTAAAVPADGTGADPATAPTGAAPSATVPTAAGAPLGGPAVATGPASAVTEAGALADAAARPVAVEDDDVAAAAPAVEGPAAPVPAAGPAPAPVQAPAGPGPSSAPAALDPLAASTSEQVRPALSELARGLRDEGGTASLVVRLDPPELGPVLVRLSVVDGRVDVTLRAPEAEAARGLALTSSEVARVLADHGLDLAAFDVDTGVLPGAGSQGEREDRTASSGSDGSSGRGTPGRGQDADNHGDAPRVRVTDDALTPGGTPAGTWL